MKDLSSGSVCYTDPAELVKAGMPAMLQGGDFAQYVEPSTSAEDKETINAMAKQNAEASKENNCSCGDIQVLSVKEDGDDATVKISMKMVMGDIVDVVEDNVAVKKIDGKWYFRASDFLG